MEDGVVRASEKGTGQGSVISPLLANIYLHYVLDLWVDRHWRRRCYRRCESAQRWRTQRSRRGQPSTSAAESGWMTSPVKAGLWPPPPAADDLDGACRPAVVRHQGIDG